MRIAGMPDYDADMLQRLGEQDRRIAAVFARHGYASVEPPIVEPADVFLEQSGEDIRRRIYVFNDPSGTELCLRPDLTIPACRMYLRSPQASGPARFCYNGPAFRFQPAGRDRPSQFLQAGVECLDITDTEAADAEVFCLTVQAVEAAGLADYVSEIGDVGLFFGLVDRLSLPGRWQDRLKRQMWRPERLQELLTRLCTDQDEQSAGRAAFLEALGALDDNRARLAIEEVLRMSGIEAAGGRDVDEIARRFLEQAGDVRSGGLSQEVVGLINAYFDISGTASASVSAIRELAKQAGISLADEINRFERRLALIDAGGIAAEQLSYTARFGRGLEYYTGFVFELSVPELGEHAQIAGGGRYDRLLRQLGADRDIPAIGSAIRTEWLLAAQGAAS